jgi:sec-independent protein translocase protein TatA
MPLLAGLGPLGVPELLIIAFIIVLIFGVGRLTDVGGALGKSVREFRKATKDDDSTGSDSSTMASAAAGASPASMPNSVPSNTAQSTNDVGEANDSRFCAECGARNTRAAKFCAECGHSMGVAAG